MITDYLLQVIIILRIYRYLVSAHWWSFNDPQSQIAHYEWRAGTTPIADNIIEALRVHHSEFAIAILEDSLPVNTTIYVTLRAYNRAGMWIERTTNGFVVDDTRPIILQNVTRNNVLGSGNQHFQVCIEMAIREMVPKYIIY